MMIFSQNSQYKFDKAMQFSSNKQNEHTFKPTQLKGKLKQLGKYEFSLDQKLGSGLTSDAYVGVNKETQQLVCVKAIDLLIFKNETQKSLLNSEIKCQQKLKSKFIISILDVFETNSFCFVVTELCQDGDLFKLIKFAKSGLPEKLVIKLGLNLAEALLIMKQNCIIHRDIKSQNIMLSKGVAKLGDFGFAIEESNLKDQEQFNLGSPIYMPLQALESNHYSYSSDIFSYGVVLYEMLHGQSPWECSEQSQLIVKMKTEEISFKNDVSQKMREIISLCLEMSPQKRATIEKIMQLLRSLSEQR